MAKKAKATTSFAGVTADVILGLDMSLKSPGWARYNVATGELESGFVDIEKMKITGMDRIRFLRDMVIELADIEGKSVFAFIEGYSFASRGRAGLSLAELGGAVRIGLSDLNVRFYEIPPASLKKYVTGKGKGSDKAVMLKELLKRFGHDIDQNDEGDAVALVELGKALLGSPSKPLVQFQQEVISAL
jgi:Holliday junction resolvasome RuvABC endonuclease subunit